MGDTDLTRRRFVKGMIGGSSGLLAISRFALAKEGSASGANGVLLAGGKFRIDHRWSDCEATVGIEGLTSRLKVLHLSDSHLTCSDETDIPFLKYSKRMDNAYKTTKHYETNSATNPLESFRGAMKLAQVEKVDMIVLTGDIVNNPSSTSVSVICEELKKTGIPYVYVSGNHDWHYEGMEGTANELREVWRKKGLGPLYRTESPSHYAVVKGGVNFIAIDNSTYQVSEEQLRFFEEQIALGLPSVLLMHIPICLKSFPAMACGHPEWGSKVDRGYKVERRLRWPEEGNLKSTMGFVKAVCSSNNLAAILCGHTHSPRTDRVVPLAFSEIGSPSAMQYVARAGAVGGYRLVYFEGL